MSMKANIASEAELAKTTVLNSPLDDDTKRNLVLLISKAAHATNGITQEEKIQSLTECMSSLASVLALYISKSNIRICKLEEKFEEEHPSSKLERVQKFEYMLGEAEKFRNTNGIVPNIRISGEYFKDIIDKSVDYIDERLEKHNNELHANNDKSLTESIISILKKPYAWIFASVAVCSPFAVDVINAILHAFGK